MAHYCKQVSNSNSALYTVQRHQEILHDYNKEFIKTRASIENQMQRERLFGGRKNDSE